MKNLLKMAVPSRTTLQILKYARKIKPDTIQLTTLDNWITVKSREIKDHPGKFYDTTILNKTGNLSAARYNDLFAYDFPIMPKIGEVKKVSLPYDLLAILPGFKAYTSKDFSTRISLTGVLLSTKKGAVCATDGHRLKEQLIKCPDKFEDIIIPVDFVIFIANMMRKKAVLKDYFFCHRNEQPYVSVSYLLNDALYTITSRCIEGPYPDYEKIIPKSSKVLSKVTPDQVKNALEVIKSGEQYEFENIKLPNLAFDDSRFIKYTPAGYYSFQLPCVITPNALLNGSYVKEMLQDVFKNSASKLLVYKAKNALSATMFMSGTITYIIMPNKFNSEDKDYNEYIKSMKVIKA